MERKFEVRGLVSFSLVVPAFLEACISASSFGVRLRHYLRLASQPGLVKNEKQEKKTDPAGAFCKFNFGTTIEEGLCI